MSGEDGNYFDEMTYIVKLEAKNAQLRVMGDRLATMLDAVLLSGVLKDGRIITEKIESALKTWRDI